MSEPVLICGDCLEAMRRLPERSVDLVFGSPPYEAARTYGIGFNLQGQAWVDWMVAVAQASLRVCRGLVAFVVEGRTRAFKWSATPVLLMADLHRAGVTLRKPPAFCRVGIPGSGGPDWWRNDYEFIVCATHGGRLPWSNNIACGHPPKWGPGGEMSYRQSSGTRRNAWGQSPNQIKGGCGTMPVLANPGNVIWCKVGGGVMGSKITHENEAPFPEALAERFIKSFCPPDGVVLDPFGGGGTTMAVAVKNGRQAISIDIRESQIELHRRRLKEIDAEARPATARLEREGADTLFTNEVPNANV